MPLVLANGPEEILQQLFLKVERLFDCLIYPMALETIDLKWMSALWAGTALENTENSENGPKRFKKSDFFKMRFKMTKKVEGIETVDVRFSGEQIRTYWEK